MHRLSCHKQAHLHAASLGNQLQLNATAYSGLAGLVLNKQLISDATRMWLQDAQLVVLSVHCHSIYQTNATHPDMLFDGYDSSFPTGLSAIVLCLRAGVASPQLSGVGCC